MRAFPVLLAGCLLAGDAAWARFVLSRQDFERDWERQSALREAPSGAVTPAEDAAGALDGVINGAWGFHTEIEDDPWWQVDLGDVVPLDRIVLYNRTEFAERNARIMVLLSGGGAAWREAYRHDGAVFLGHADGKPLAVALGGQPARFVRLALAGRSYFHLDEVEIYRHGAPQNIARGTPAAQSSTSQWSVRHGDAGGRGHDVPAVLARGAKLAGDLRAMGVDVAPSLAAFGAARAAWDALGSGAAADARRRIYFDARAAVRALAVRNPLLDFDRVLFVMRAPGTLPHMSDQHYGWWSRPGGGIFILEDFRTEAPRARCLTEGWPAGSFQGPDLSYDGRRVLFAYCRHFAHVSGMQKVDKEALPEDAFYNLYEMDLDGANVRRLTRGRYDDFDARYLPGGSIAFLSTRKGRFLRSDAASAQATTRATHPDSYVRCGGDAMRPCAVFTLHAMEPDGSDLRPISAFENFEWTPSVADDGRVLYARWDYIDRFNGPFMSLWSTNPDGANPQLVYGNFTKAPQCVFEARSIPGSTKLVFTASAHHSITGGSLALLDRAHGTEGERPLTRISPEVKFPESEGWDAAYYANPWPLSETYHLVAWSDRRLPPHAGSAQIADDRNPVNASGIYLYDAFGNLELLWRDPAISSVTPIPVKARPRPPVIPDAVARDGPKEGSFLLQDVYRGLPGVPRGAIAKLRIIGVPPKPQPFMNTPNLGVSSEDPGKYILGTVPVREDGSAYFRVPSGIPLFFQALDRDGFAVQTMRTLTYVQPGRTLGCIGCHEPRDTAPPATGLPRALAQAPSTIAPGPPGTWPLRFDTLVQPVLDAHCTACHAPGSKDERARRLDLAPPGAYDALVAFADRDLERLAFEKDVSVPGDMPARKSRLLAALRDTAAHGEVALGAQDLERLVTWMDVYAHRLGSFSDEQEAELEALRREMMRLPAD